MKKVLLASIFLTACAGTFDLSPIKPARKVVEEEVVEKSVKWEKFTPKIIERAKAEKKYVAFYIGSSKCKFCKEMERTVFKSDCVVSALNDAKTFIAVKVDVAEKMTEPERVLVDMIYSDAPMIVPVFLVTTSEGDMVGDVLLGVVPEERVCSMLVKATKEKQ